MSLLSVEDLHVHFIARGLNNQLRTAKALNGVSFTLEPGQVLGLVGETGAGKSLTALALLGLLRPPAQVVAGKIQFEGQALGLLDQPGHRSPRGKSITLIPQSPKTSLDPTARIGDQLIRIQREHGQTDTAKAHARAIEMLGQVQIPDPVQRMKAWPHELSGGMAQRVLIAAGLINSPRLVIADEPTTGLDLTVQAEVLDIFKRLVKANGMSAIIITHDLGIVAHYCDRMAVMFAGTIIEEGPVNQVFGAQSHPYTQSLIASTPKHIARHGFASAVGSPPNLYDLPSGCVYKDRCPKAQAVCDTRLPTLALGDGHRVRCHLPNPPA
jgi:peptide/nickel transport system ATP-binding protein/oligopeptide transport system ATP-binding protein